MNFKNNAIFLLKITLLLLLLKNASALSSIRCLKIVGIKTGNCFSLNYNNNNINIKNQIPSAWIELNPHPSI
jgi:hypothetical protein